MKEDSLLKYDVLSIGEMIIDFVPQTTGVGLKDVPGFVKAPGGAPANVAVGVAKLGGRAAFAGKFGADAFGDFLIGVLEECGVATDGCVQTQDAKTGLAFIAVDKTGEREFQFYRDPSADMLLEVADIDAELVKSARIVHVGSVTQLRQEAYEATIKALQIAREHGVITSFDVNFRLGIWRVKEEEGRAKILSTIGLTDVLKVSEWEMEFLTGTADVKEGAAQLQALGPKVVFVTLAEKGVWWQTGANSGVLSTWRVDVKDATGAGDAFVAGFLRQLSDRVQGRTLEYSLSIVEEIEEMARYANAVAAITVSRMGAIPALPTKEEVFQFMYANRRRKRSQ